jgi:hypothetical protein
MLNEQNVDQHSIEPLQVMQYDLRSTLGRVGRDAKTRHIRLLVVAAWSRAAILAGSQGTTRESFIPAVSITAGYFTPSLTWY